MNYNKHFFKSVWTLSPVLWWCSKFGPQTSISGPGGQCLVSNSLVCSLYCIAENFRKFRGFVAIHKSFFLREILGVWRPLALQKQAIRESFLHKNRIFTNSRKFSAIRYQWWCGGLDSQRCALNSRSIESGAMADQLCSSPEDRFC